MQRSYDNWALKQKWHDYKLKKIVQNQRLDHSAHADFGSDIAVSRFVIRYCIGQVRNENGRWIEKETDLPKHYSKSFKLTGISAKKARLVNEGIDNFVGLDYCETIDLSNNPRLDNFACDQLARQFRKSKHLTEVDLSYNPRISVHGLEILFRIPSLRRVIAIDTAATKYEDIDLFVLGAKDERACDVFVHPDGKKYLNPELEELRLVNCEIK